MAKQKHWLHKEIPLDTWIHKPFHFKNDTEYLVFMVWALFVVVFFTQLIR